MKKALLVSIALVVMYVVGTFAAGTTVNGTRVINGDLTVKGTCTGCGSAVGLVGPLDTVNVSGQSALTMSAAACFTSSTYDNIILKLTYAVPGTSGDNLYLRFNGDTGTNYTWSGFRNSNSGSAISGAVATNQILLDTNGTVGTNALGWTGTIELFGIGSGKQQHVQYEGGYLDPSPAPSKTTEHGFYLSTTAITSVTFEYANAGTVHTISGTAKCYGVAKS